MPNATITSKGQITIPKKVRNALGLGTGDQVTFHVRKDGVAEMRPDTIDLLSLSGILRPEVRGVTVERMNEVIRKAGSGR